MSRDITMCHPELQEKANKLIAECKKKGLIVRLGECFRSVTEQNTLYAQGRTAPGNVVTNAKGSTYSSMHQWGIAFDVMRSDGRGAYYNGDGWFNRVGKIGKSLGLEWGGDWTSPVDLPHFQLPQWGSTPARLKQLYGNFDNFKKTWSSYKAAEIKEEKDMTEGEVRKIAEQAANDMIYKYSDKIYNKAEEVPAWGRDTVNKLIDKGVLKGTDKGLDLSYTLLRLLVINDRAGLYD
ncbi:MAG: M15 family metallopeptidase [Clostridia bacterium]|nr:M15 family metallopeptidase [Clostridia bacterium]